jgi:outer membrane lipoprotein carrier protein
MPAIAVLVCIGVALLAAPPAAAQQANLGQVISKIEFHYNSLATLQTQFEQKVSYMGQRPRIERGTVYVRRPQKMRWEYSQPEGKLLVGDGELLHMYNPMTNQVRRIDLSQAGDLRALLSFLLGRLRFRQQFRNLRLEPTGGRHVLVGEGRPGRDPYGRVEFTYDPQSYTLLHIKVMGHDETVTEFTFSAERVNATLDLSLFTFRTPAGAEVLDEPSREGQ